MANSRGFSEASDVLVFLQSGFGDIPWNCECSFLVL